MKKVRATKENLLKLFKERRRLYEHLWRRKKDLQPELASAYLEQACAMDFVISCMSDSKDFNDYWHIFFPGE